MTIDTPAPQQMARWLRETAANTRAKRDSPHLSEIEINLAPHVAFRLEQAANMLDKYQRAIWFLQDIAAMSRKIGSETAAHALAQLGEPRHGDEDERRTQ